MSTILSFVDTGEFQLSSQISHQLRRAHQRAGAIFSAALDDPQLTLTQWAALVALTEEGPQSQNRLGRFAHMDPATTQGVVLRLLERGLVERRDDPNDRRRAIISLNETGRELVERLTPAAIEANERTLEPLSREERAVFLRLLSRLM